MALNLLTAWSLMALCVLVHAIGVAYAVRWVRQREVPAMRTKTWVWLFIRVAGWIILLHVVEIVAWGLVYAVAGAVQGMPSSLYFSAVTYTTTGYGDVVLPEDWRLVGAIEALTGILMCGWSTGFFVAVVSRMFDVGAEPVQPRR